MKWLEKLEEAVELSQMLDRVREMAKTDDWYQQCLADLRAKEPAFLALRETLTQTQREQLDAYISACEELEHSKVFLAYELGHK